jgi:hypothetical protein
LQRDVFLLIEMTFNIWTIYLGLILYFSGTKKSRKNGGAIFKKTHFGGPIDLNSFNFTLKIKTSKSFSRLLMISKFYIALSKVSGLAENPVK